MIRPATCTESHSGARRRRGVPRADVTGFRDVRLCVVLVVAATLVTLTSCGTAGDRQSSSQPPATATTSDRGGGSAPATSSVTTGRPSAGPRSTRAAVPGGCTAAACPSLGAPATRLMSGNITKNNAAARVPGYLRAVLDDLDRTWKPWFSELGWGDPAPGRVLVSRGEQFASRCADRDTGLIASDTPNAFFCPLDEAATGTGARVRGSVILPVQAFVGIWTGVFLTPGPLDGIGGFQGEFTAATVVAHEYGHAVVNHIRQASGRVVEPSAASVVEPFGEDSELIADCLAGNWASTVLARDELSIADIAQAVALLGKLGDSRPGQGHGTAAQRIEALSLGFFGTSLGRGKGQPINCLTRYWPEVFG